MIDWRPTLVNEIVKERCILFLGSGVSATARDAAGKSPPTWTQFLKNALSLVRDATIRANIEALIDQKKLLIGLQAIQDHSDTAEYYSLLNTTFNGNYKASKLHEIITQLDCRIVVTTNFDKIYESYYHTFSPNGLGYKVLSYRDDGFSDEIRSNTRLIIKAHGSIHDIRNMIFTRSEYHRAKQEYSRFYEILKALLLTNTIVFIGCGLDDPDMMLLLEDVKIAGRSEKPHYALALARDRDFFSVQDWKSTYNIQVLEYGPTHDDLAADLEALLNLVNQQKAVGTL